MFTAASVMKLVGSGKFRAAAGLGETGRASGGSR